MSKQLEYLRQMVSSLRPGDRAEFSRDLLMIDCPPPWKPADWILEGIIGAAYEFSYYRNTETGNIVFRRWQEPLQPESGVRHYVSADRREYFVEYRPGYWVHKEEMAKA